VKVTGASATMILVPLPLRPGIENPEDAVVPHAMIVPSATAPLCGQQRFDALVQFIGEFVTASGLPLHATSGSLVASHVGLLATRSMADQLTWRNNTCAKQRYSSNST
jgi:hypothetical protein